MPNYRCMARIVILRNGEELQCVDVSMTNPAAISGAVVDAFESETLGGMLGWTDINIHIHALQTGGYGSEYDIIPDDN